jgi:hypothetical protein
VIRLLHRRDQALGSPPAVRRLGKRSDAIVYGAAGVFFIALTIAIAVTFIADSDTSATLWLTLLALLGFGVTSLAFARTSVVISANEPSFVVRNMYKRYEVRWADVSGFEAGTFIGPWVARYVVRDVVARLTNGRKVNCNALHGTRNEVARYVDEMNSELARRHGATG